MTNVRKKLKGAKKSLTVKFNMFMAAFLPAVVYAQEMLPLLKELMTVEVYQVTGLVVVLVNILLRFKTKECLGDKDAE